MNFHDNLGTEFEFRTYNSLETNYKITDNYFKEAGYTKNEESIPNNLSYKQGSKLKNAFTTNPLKWKSEFIISISENYIHLSCFIDTTNQLVSQSETECWNRFIANFEKSINQQKNLFHLNNEFVKKSKKATLKYITYGVIVTIVSLTIFGVIADYFKLSSKFIFLPTFSITTIVLLLIQRKMNNDKIL